MPDKNPNYQNDVSHQGIMDSVRARLYMAEQEINGAGLSEREARIRISDSLDLTDQFQRRAYEDWCRE